MKKACPGIEGIPAMAAGGQARSGCHLPPVLRFFFQICGKQRFHFILKKVKDMKTTK
jgi:hypothetical protein